MSTGFNPALTDAQYAVLKHTLGKVSTYGTRFIIYRNRYFAAPGHGRYETCRELVGKGFMALHEPEAGSSFFFVTGAGIKAFKKEIRKQYRAQGMRGPRFVEIDN